MYDICAVYWGGSIMCFRVKYIGNYAMMSRRMRRPEEGAAGGPSIS